jgi:pre-mRNA-processing factor 17
MKSLMNILDFLGQVKSKFSMRKIPYCISFNPSENKQHLFICGMSDKKILCVSIINYFYV